jgi:hypothetical protein
MKYQGGQYVRKKNARPSSPGQAGDLVDPEDDQGAKQIDPTLRDDWNAFA